MENITHKEFNDIKSEKVKLNLLDTYGKLLGSNGASNKFLLYKVNGFYVEVITEKLGKSIIAKTFLRPLDRLYYGLAVQIFGNTSADEAECKIID